MLTVTVGGYQLLRRLESTHYWAAAAFPGIASMGYLVIAHGWSRYVLVWAVACLAQVVFSYLRHGYAGVFVQTVPAAEIQAGTFLRQSLHLRLTEGEEFHCPAGVPLTQEQVYRLRGLARARGPLSEQALETEQGLPFGPLIAASGALCAALGGGLVPPLRWLVQWLAG